MKKHIQTQHEWEVQMATQILEFVQNELFIDMPYMSIALNALELQVNHEQIETMATDGRRPYSIQLPSMYPLV